MAEAKKKLQSAAVTLGPAVTRALVKTQADFASHAMDHPSMLRRVVFVLLCGAWLFLLLALGSFHATDWPSHAVYPYPAVQNVCGYAGAFVSYYLYLTLGQGVFPVLFFSGVCLALSMYGSRISDMWLRVIGLALLAVAFAAVTHMVRPGSKIGFPEGNGGILGIGAASFLQGRCSTVLTGLILICTFLVGLLLCADDLVIKAPAMIGRTIQTVKDRAPAIKQFNWNIVPLPKLPSLPQFVTKDAAGAAATAKANGPIQRITTDDVGVDDSEDTPLLRPVGRKPIAAGARPSQPPPMKSIWNTTTTNQPQPKMRPTATNPTPPHQPTP